MQGWFALHAHSWRSEHKDSDGTGFCVSGSQRPTPHRSFHQSVDAVQASVQTQTQTQTQRCDRASGVGPLGLQGSEAIQSEL